MGDGVLTVGKKDGSSGQFVYMSGKSVGLSNKFESFAAIGVRVHHYQDAWPLCPPSFLSRRSSPRSPCHPRSGRATKQRVAVSSPTSAKYTHGLPRSIKRDALI